MIVKSCIDSIEQFFDINFTPLIMASHPLTVSSNKKVVMVAEAARLTSAYTFYHVGLHYRNSIFVHLLEITHRIIVYIFIAQPFASTGSKDETQCIIHIMMEDMPLISTIGYLIVKQEEIDLVSNYI